MRIAYVCADPGIPVTGTKGASIHIQQIVRAFVRRGDDVTVYCSRLGDGSATGLDDVRFVHRPVPSSDAVGREAAVADISRELARLAVEDGCELVYERYSLFADAAAHVDVPSIVEVNAPLIEEQQRYRTLVDLVGAEGSTRSVLSGADVVTCVSEPVARWASMRGAPAERTIVVPNGVDTRRYRTDRRRTSSRLQAVFVGSLKPWHGVETVIDALRLVDGVDLTIVGDGPERVALTARAEGLEDRVRWTGAVPHDDVAAILDGMDVGLAPYPERAGDYFSPLKVYEYLAAGIPTIASTVGQLSSIVQHERTGLLVTPDDAGATAEALARLRDDRTGARHLGVAARERAVERHDWDRVLEDILAPLSARSATGRPASALGSAR